MTENKENTDGLYTGARGIAVRILNRVDRTDAYLDKLLDTEIRNNELSSVDKALLFEIVHGVIRWLGRIDWILTGFYKGQFPKMSSDIKNALRVALYQILFLDKIPDYAAVNEAVEFVKKYQGQKAGDMVNGLLRNIVRNKNNIRYANPEEDEVSFLSAYYSHPSWLVRRWLKLFGREFTEELLKANLKKPALTLRVNKLVTTPEEFEELLKSVNLKFERGKYLDNFYRLHGLTNITDWKYFAKGYFSVQDESTGFACKLLDPQPGMKVVDLCAAPGGKTGYLAELMNNEGELVAVDRYESRLKILEKNLERLQVRNVRPVVKDALEFEETGFDRVLLDVPCTGFGTLTKKPEIKWKKDMSDIRRLSKLQYNLLVQGGKILKVGGFLVYSTCTIEPEENFEVIKKFLFEHPEFQISDDRAGLDDSLFDDYGCIQTYPHIHGTDGAFAVKLKKVSSEY
jgi:16S rRNA (cytosine967-C5)-methyltransferase